MEPTDSVVVANTEFTVRLFEATERLPAAVALETEDGIFILEIGEALALAAALKAVAAIAAGDYSGR